MARFAPTVLPTGAYRVTGLHSSQWIVDKEGNIIGQTGANCQDTFFYSSTNAGAAALASTSGLGTMCVQNAVAVAITGGAINNTTIGATTPSTGTFAALSTNTTRSTGATGRAVNTTAALASVTIGSIQSTFLATPAAAITITLPAPTDGFRTRVVFGAATTVTWAVTAPATALIAGVKTVFAAGESYELIYSSVAGTPANAVATTWYPY
jgi:hypothetical protein